MIRITIPRGEELLIENIVFDFNGTIATGGKLDSGVKEIMNSIKEKANIYILTSDTYGTVKEECKCLGVNIHTLEGTEGGAEKGKFVRGLGKDKTICVGNGANDAEMFKICALSIAIIGEEGCSFKALSSADIVVKNSIDALALIDNPNRIKATLRR